METTPFTVRGIMNRAKGLLASPPPETMTEKFARQDAERAAKTPPVVTPTPEPTEKPGIIDKINARNKLLQGLKDGGTVRAGIIRGPGTGTSDSIKGKMPVGSFVMPKDSTDVMVSNGETNFTPEMVQQIGAAALMATKGLTHTPVAEQSAAKFANGGVVDEEKKPMSYGDQMRNVGRAIVSAPIEAAKTLVSAPGYGFSKDATPLTTPAARPTVAPSQSVTPGVSPTGGITTPIALTAPSAPVQPVVAALAAPLNNQVTRVGNSYTGAPNITGDISINGKSAVGQQVYPAAQALATPTQTSPAIEQGGVNYGDGSGRPGLGFSANLARKNAETGASSIFNTASRQTARDQLKAMDAQELAGTNNQSTQAIAKMQGDNNLAASKLSADTQRVGYGIQSQNNLATQQNAAARLGIDRTAAGLANQQTVQKLAGDKQLQDLQTKLLTAKPEERESVLDNLRAFQKSYDKPIPDLFGTIETGQDQATGAKTFSTYDKRTGQIVQQQGQKQATPPQAGAVVDGYRFKGGNPSDKNNWEKK